MGGIPAADEFTKGGRGVYNPTTVQEPNTEDDPQFVSFGGGHFLPTLEDMLALGAYTLVRYWV